MARVILGLVFFAAVVLAIASVVTLVRSLFAPLAAPVAPAAPGPKEDHMPDMMRNIAYVLLLILLVGVATGWLGAA